MLNIEESDSKTMNNNTDSKVSVPKQKNTENVTVKNLSNSKASSKTSSKGKYI